MGLEMRAPPGFIEPCLPTNGRASEIGKAVGAGQPDLRSKKDPAGGGPPGSLEIMLIVPETTMARLPRAAQSQGSAAGASPGR